MWNSADKLLEFVLRRERLVIFSFDLEGKILYSEGKGLGNFGLKPGELVGQSMFHIAHDDPGNIDLVRRALRGETFVAQGAYGGQGKIIEVQFEPFYDEDGKLAGSIGVGIDVTERERHYYERDLLIEISKVLAEAVDREKMIDAVARLTIPLVADFCTIYLADKDQYLRLAAAAHVDPQKEDVLFEVQRHYMHDRNPDSEYPSVRAFLTGKSVLSSSFTDSYVRKIAADEVELTSIRKLNIVSSICVPLIAHGKPLGVMALARCDSSSLQQPGDLKLAEDIARRVAFAVEITRRLEHGSENA